MRRFFVIPVSLVAALALGACGGSGSAKATSTTTGQGAQAAGVTYKPAGANPSVSAKMICEAEAQSDIADAIELKATRVTTPTWVDHLYSCAYVYPKGKIVLSVKELSDANETTAYFNSLAAKYGKRQTLNGLAQGAFLAPNDDVVARKDYKVLLVDVSGIPQNFEAASTRSDVAQNVASAILQCWSGA